MNDSLNSIKIMPTFVVFAAIISVCCWSIAVHPVGLTIEIGETAEFAVATTRVGEVTYKWKKGGEPLMDDDRFSGSQGRLLTIQQVEFADSGAYTVLESTACRSEESMRAVLSVPCAADKNGDGFVNTTDGIEFLNLWVAEDDRADINDDGGVDTRDFIAFLNAWVAGC